jgi:hypothetical protein
MCHSTCCNNTASEHAMMLRLMVDDITHWAKDYKVGLWAGGGLGGLPWLWFHGGFSHWHVCRADNNMGALNPPPPLPPPPPPIGACVSPQIDGFRFDIMGHHMVDHM